jgi:hypothetical protein
MRIRDWVAAAGVATVASIAVVSPASAACQRFGFTVNDYGKEGPTADAKRLLDTHIAKKLGECGIKTYTTGKKSVKCELFLDVIIFDEHTCTAEATACWGGSALPKGQQVTTENKPAPAAKTKEVAEDAAPTPAKEEPQTETGSISKPVENKVPVEDKAAADVSKEVIERLPPSEKIEEAAPADASETPSAAP